MNPKTASLVLFAWILGFCLTVSLPLHAQVAGATLSGTVSDQSGAVVPKTEISITNAATGFVRTSTTSAAGFYSVPNLLPGTYQVRATASGFATELQNVTLTVGEEKALDFALQVGQTSQTVVVTTEAPNVELASSSISAVINSTTVRELPLNGRSWTDLATLQPGVSSAFQIQPDFAIGGDRGNRGFGNQITVAGDRPEQNNYRLDGISINDFNNSAPGSILGGDMGVDAVQEFSVITSNVSAAYGKTSGGVINAITKSGTNQFHGSAYEFLRNDKLDAANFFENANGLKKASFRQNQFGVSAGAPLRKDKLFIFGDYEGLRYVKGLPVSISVPSNNARLGILAGGTPVNQPAGTPCTNGTPPNTSPGHYLSPQATICVDDNSAKYLPIWPVSAKTNPDGNTASYGFTGLRRVTENFFTVRLDSKITSKDNLAATYLYDFTPFSQPDGLDAVLVNSKTDRQMVSLEETHTFSSSLVNSVRGGFNREYELNDKGVAAINPLANDPSLAAVFGPGIPQQYAAHVVVGSGEIDPFNGGVNGNSFSLYGWNSYQGYDDAFWTHGTHSVKFGGGVERQQINRLAHTDPSGVFSFNDLNSFLTNSPHRFTGEDFTSVREQGLRQTIFGVYLQDDWRFRPNLTLNLGLRWEMATAINDNHGGIINLVNLTDPLPLCGTFIPGCAPGGPLFANGSLNNFEPRVGFAWDPFHNGKTAVRASFGMFDILHLNHEFLSSATKQAPFVSSGAINSPGQGTFYTGAFPLLTPKTGGSNSVEQYPHRSYVMQWNFNIQREVVKDLTVMVGYVGSRGVHEPFRVDDADIVMPTLIPGVGYLYPQVDAAGNFYVPGQCNATDPHAKEPNCSGPSTINGGFGSIGFLRYQGNSYYHALEAAVQKTMSHGIQFQTSFTWGKSMDTGSASGHGDQFSNSISSLPFYDLRLLKARSDFDIKRTLVIDLTWQVPSPKSLSGPAGWVASGWELGSIFKVSDGIPFTATWGTGSDPQGLLNSDDWAFSNRLFTPGCTSPINSGNPAQYVKTQCFTVPTAPSRPFFDANCDPAPPSLGYGFNPANPADPTWPGLNGNTPPSWLPALACFNLRGNSPRNFLTGPGTTNLDFSVFKNNPIKRISENFNIQFRAEFFNILNHANFEVPPIAFFRTDIFDGTGNLSPVAGQLVATSTPGREIQFALKLTW